MPSKGTTKKAAKSCLVCGGITQAAHLGIDLCRACAIFYRRNPKRRARTCRANTDQCPAGKDLNCKKCRFDWIERMLKRKHIPRSKASYTCRAHSQLSTVAPVAEVEGSSKSSTSASIQATPCAADHGHDSLSMCHTRMIAEMHARGDPPHPLLMDVDAPSTLPAVCKTMHIANKILLASLLEFGKAAFPDFTKLQAHEQWSIVSEFFYRFRAFEGCCRANECFPDHPTRFLPSFTSFLSPEVYDKFYDKLPQNADLEGAVSYFKNSTISIKEVPMARECIARLKPAHDEFLAVIGLMFWCIEALPHRQHLSDLAEKYRKQIMTELHVYYKEKLKMDDYAPRLGELLMFIQVFDVKERFQEHFENLRLLNILDDDNFIYRLQKE
ncbi:hypothetical protein PRIPAC_80214 [Pristionchus pacificus]|uniref:Nuclear receptor n=1 Tax=Pristionchus pacificus TaxID=54126 RepID=A0A2A6CK20_PRIPA|nr:hypothetical protein PRIPAC_80214 [Pristionchus pacificus]|eukprot:PDM78428.1 nuclear receptor [Pristionchus pacificus]